MSEELKPDTFMDQQKWVREEEYDALRREVEELKASGRDHFLKGYLDGYHDCTVRKDYQPRKAWEAFEKIAKEKP